MFNTNHTNLNLCAVVFLVKILDKSNAISVVNFKYICIDHMFFFPKKIDNVYKLLFYLKEKKPLEKNESRFLFIISFLLAWKPLFDIYLQSVEKLFNICIWQRAFMQLSGFLMQNSLKSRSKESKKELEFKFLSPQFTFKTKTETTPISRFT